MRIANGNWNTQINIHNHLNIHSTNINQSRTKPPSSIQQQQYITNNFSTHSWKQSLISNLMESFHQIENSSFGQQSSTTILCWTMMESYTISIYINSEASLLPVAILTHLRTWAVSYCHDNLLSGHLKFAKTYSKVRQRFWFSQMHTFIHNNVKKCTKCQLKDKARWTVIPLHQMFTEGPYAVAHVNLTKTSGKTS